MRLMGPQSGLSKTNTGKSFWTTTQLGPGFLTLPPGLLYPNFARDPCLPSIGPKNLRSWTATLPGKSCKKPTASPRLDDSKKPDYIPPATSLSSACVSTVTRYDTSVCLCGIRLGPFVTWSVAPSVVAGMAKDQGCMRDGART